MIVLSLISVLLSAGLVVLLLQNTVLRRRLREAEHRLEVAADTPENPDYQLFLELERRMDSEQLFLDPSLDRDKLCELLHLDKNGLARVIGVYSNCGNLRGYINRKRVEYATRLMRQHPEWTLQAIAESSGMRSFSTFSRVFAQVYGQSPSAYYGRLQLSSDGE